MDQQLQRRQTGEITPPVATITQGFGTQELTMRGERSSDAVAARETAAVQARFVVAIQRPRDTMDFRTRLLHECKRPGFAEVAMFKRPVGKKKMPSGKWEETFAEGPSIRMIETCLQLYRNVQATSTTVYDGPDLRIVKVLVIDFENNISFEQEVNVPKAVEKRGFDGQPPKGREVLGKRLNSDGDETYLVAATDDEVTIKQAALVSKALRTCGQRLLPRDVIEEAIAQIRATKTAEVKADPDAAKKKIADAFAALGVNPSDIGAYLGHSIDRATSAEIVKLREIYSSIKDGEATWEDYIQAANTTPDPDLQQEVLDRLVSKADGKRTPPSTADSKQVTVTQVDDPQQTEPATSTDGYAPEPSAATFNRNRRGFNS
jgi:hypothetical protein